MDPMTPRPVSPGVRGYSYGVSLGEFQVGAHQWHLGAVTLGFL
jgi:hypothetical protein